MPGINTLKAVMQAKDIPDEVFLLAVSKHSSNIGAQSWDVIVEIGFPAKVVRAKAASLIRRGKLEGCPIQHNCRGDWTLPSTTSGPVTTARITVTDSIAPGSHWSWPSGLRIARNVARKSHPSDFLRFRY